MLLRAKSPPFSLSPRPKKSCLFEAVQTALRCGFPGFLTNAARSPGAFLLFKKRHVLFSACGAGSVRFRFPSKGVSHGFAAAPSSFQKAFSCKPVFPLFRSRGRRRAFFQKAFRKAAARSPFSEKRFPRKAGLAASFSGRNRRPAPSNGERRPVSAASSGFPFALGALRRCAVWPFAVRRALRLLDLGAVGRVLDEIALRRDLIAQRVRPLPVLGLAGLLALFGLVEDLLRDLVFFVEDA